MGDKLPTATLAFPVNPSRSSPASKDRKKNTSGKSEPKKKSPRAADAKPPARKPKRRKTQTPEARAASLANLAKARAARGS